MQNPVQPGRKNSSVLKFIETYSGFLVAMMGLPVIMHWYKDFPAWVQMQPNVAIGFIILGLSFVMLEFKKFSIVQALTITLFLLGMLTLAEYLTGYDLGIDELIKDGLMSVYANSRGRMAPNSALSFVLMSVVLWTISRKNATAKSIFLAGIVSLLPLASCTVTVISHSLSISNTYGWGSYSLMAIPTAVGFVLGGLLSLHKIYRLLSPHVNRNTYLKPLYLTLLLFSVMMSFWQFFLIFNANKLSALTEEKLRSSLESIKLQLAENALALKRMGQRIDHAGFKETKLLAFDAKAYLDDFAGMKSIGISNGKSEILWSIPKIKDGAFFQHFDPQLELLQDKYRLIAHESKLVFLFPLHLQNNSSSYLFATIDSKEFLENVLGFDDFDLRVKLNDVEVLHRLPEKNISERVWTRSNKIKFDDVSFYIELTPTREGLGKMDSYFPGFILIVGLLFSMFVGVSLQEIFQSRDKKNLMIESEMRFRHLIESLKDYAVFMLDPYGDIITWNNGALKLYGYDSNEVLGKNLSIFYSVEDLNQDKPSKDLVRARLTGKLEEEVLRIKKDGSSFLANSTLTRITDSNGQLIGYGEVIRDLTEQKAIEASKLASAAWQKAMVESASYSIISTNAEGIIQTFNSTSEKMLGYKAVDMIGIQSPAILHDANEVIKRASELSRELGREIMPGFDVFVIKSRLKDVADENEWTYICKDGSRLPVSLSVTTLRGIEGEITGYLGIASDLTEKKKTLHELQGITKKLSALINSSPISILALDENLKLTTWNPACEKVFGWTAEEALGNYMPFVPKEKISESLKVVERIRHSKVPIYFQTERMRKDGTLINIETAATPILNDKDEIEGIIAIMQDVTDKVRLENEILSTNKELKVAVEHAQRTQQKAIKATKVKSDFLANMSHEIRTPINGIIGMTNLLLDSGPQAEQREFAESIKYSADSLLAIVNDILDFSKVEAGKLELEEISFDVNEMVTETVKSLSHLAKLKNLNLELEMQKEWPTTFYGDPGRIRQVINNLVSNAIKFTAVGNVNIRLNEVKSNESESTFRLEVQDQGIGISNIVQRKLFQPFEQADNSTARKYGGTGLGLSISRKLIEMMNGSIGVSSVEGEGSTFWFEITLKVGQIINHSHQKLERVNHILDVTLLDKRILVAEDNPINQKIVLKQLEKMGLRADAVANGNEVISSLDSAPYDLVLMDCQMPEKDGYETSRYVRDNGQERYRNIPIIALTANAVNGDKEKCIAAGMSDYLIKPITAKQLGETIEKWLLLKQDVHTVDPVSNLKIERLNFDVLQELSELDPDQKNNLVHELFDLFTKETPMKIREIEKKYVENNFQEIMKIAHFLKSSGGNLGANQFEHLCHKLEHFQAWENTVSAENLISDIRDEFDQVTFAMREYLEK